MNIDVVYLYLYLCVAVPAAAASGAASMLNSTAKYLPRSLLQVGGSNGTIISAGGPLRSSSLRQSMSGGGASDSGSIFGGSSMGNNNNNSNHGTTSNSNSNSFGLVDDLDTKLFGRKEMSAFSEFIGTFENEEKRVEGGSGELIGGTQGIKIQYRVFDWNLPGDSPKYYAIVDAVQYILLRYQKPLTVIPPDISWSVKTIDAQLRKPLEKGVRQTLIALNALSFDVALTITDSHSNTPTAVVISPNTPVKGRGGAGAAGGTTGGAAAGGKTVTADDHGPMLLVKSLHGFASIIGSLVQVRVTLQALSLQLHVHNKEAIDMLGGVITLDTLASASSGHSRGGIITVDAITGSLPASARGYDYTTGEVEFDEDTGKFIGPGYTTATTATSHMTPGMKPPAPPTSASASGASASSKAAATGPGPRSIGAAPMPGTPAAEAKRLEDLKTKSQNQPLIINLLVSADHPHHITATSTANTNIMGGNKTVSELLAEKREYNSSSSSVSSTFLTLCLLLDFDDNINNAGGAADLQVSLGKYQSL